MSKSSITIAELILKAKTENLTELNLNESEERLDKLPDEIFELIDLQILKTGNTIVRKISNKIQNLRKLKVIDITRSDFEKFPLELIEVPSLTDIFLKSHSLNRLPIELKNWNNLEYLNLNNCINLNSIDGLPPNLNYLNLSRTSLRYLPPSVAQLEKLYKIVLHELDFGDFPFELIQITSLVSLFIAKNKLEKLPRQIDSLINLRELLLYGNRFEKFPEPIIGLTNLELLDLSSNYLTEIPHSINKLTRLSTLDLGNNDLTYFPDVSELKHLKSISFSNMLKGEKSNAIKVIPDWIIKLEKMENLGFRNNNIENIPKEIIEQGINAIKNFIKSKLESSEEEFLLESKMVVVGRGNVGKTVLTKKLTIPGYILFQNDSTPGISIIKSPFLFPIMRENKEEYFKFNIWDFGGQEKYDATHQLFITNRSIYLFLTEAREESNYLDFYYWLNTIKLFSNNSPVIICLSKFDERKKVIPESLYKEKFNNIVGFVDISCANGYEFTLENLKHLISKAIFLLPQTRQKLPKQWLEIRNELEVLSMTKDYIEYSEYLDLCHKYNLDQIRADFLSQFLNDLGVIIHHQFDLLLKKTVFIKTDWCVDGIYKVLDDEQVFRHGGKFTESDLKNIWTQSKFENKQSELLKLMHEYNLCFELRDGSGYLAPDLLPPDKPKRINWDEHANIKFEYEYGFMPAGILTRFIVKSHAFIKANLYWKYGVVLEYDDTKALIQEDYIHNKVTIAVEGQNKKGLLSAIRMYMEEVHKDFNKSNKLVYKEMVPCNCDICKRLSTPHFYRYETLKDFLSQNNLNIQCYESGKMILIQNLIDDVFEKKVAPKEFRKEEQGIRQIKIVLASSGTLLQERTEIEKYFSRVNDDLIEKGLYLKLNIWEKTKKTFSKGRKQNDFNELLNESDIFISLIYDKVGIFTQEEFELAYNNFINGKKPSEILVFFKNLAIKPNDLTKDFIGVLKLKEKIRKSEQVYLEFDSIESLVKQIDDNMKLIIG